MTQTPKTLAEQVAADHPHASPKQLVAYLRAAQKAQKAAAKEAHAQRLCDEFAALVAAAKAE